MDLHVIKKLFIQASEQRLGNSRNQCIPWMHYIDHYKHYNTTQVVVNFMTREWQLGQHVCKVVPSLCLMALKDYYQ